MWGFHTKWKEVVGLVVVDVTVMRGLSVPMLGFWMWPYRNNKEFFDDSWTVKTSPCCESLWPPVSGSGLRRHARKPAQLFPTRFLVRYQSPARRPQPVSKSGMWESGVEWKLCVCVCVCAWERVEKHHKTSTGAHFEATEGVISGISHHKQPVLWFLQRLDSAVMP